MTPEVKHTPGPWTYEEEAYHMEQVFGPKGLIAQVVGDSAETCANAILIAAAPDLLAALERLLGSTKRGNADDHEADCRCVIHEASAAIAKAKGE